MPIPKTCMRISLQRLMQLCNGCSSSGPGRRGQHATLTRLFYRRFPHILPILWRFGALTGAVVSSRGEVGADSLVGEKLIRPTRPTNPRMVQPRQPRKNLQNLNAENISDYASTALIIIRPVFTRSRVNTCAKQASSGRNTNSKDRPCLSTSFLPRCIITVSSRRVPLVCSPKM